MRKLLVSLAVILAFGLSGCKTMNALNSDIKSTGNKIGKGLTKAGDAIKKSVSE